MSGCTLSSSQAPETASRTFTGEVVNIVAGDLIEVRHHGQVTPIRLHGIDCPESGQKFSEDAKYRAECMAKDKTVSVVVVTHDLAGRTIGEVLLPTGESMNRELIADGYCWWYRRYAPNNSAYENLEKKARKKFLGLWMEPNPTPPWEYRANMH